MRFIPVLITMFIMQGAALADDWLIGADNPDETVTLNSDKYVDGDIIIVNNGHLNVASGATLTVTGDILMFQTAGLDITGGELHFPQTFSYQSGIGVWDNSTLTMTDAVIESNGSSFSVALASSGSAVYENVTVENGFCTWGFFDDSSITLNNCTNAGEFVPLGAVSLQINNCETVLLWISMFDGTVVDTTLPAPGDLASFTLDPSTPWATNIPYNVNLTDISNMMWGLMAKSGASATLRDSTLRTVGTYFERDNEITITGLANNADLSDSAFQWGDVNYHFINTSVQTWNFYCYGTTQLTLQSCIFGELLSDEQGEAFINSSLCDGSGGYIGAFGDSVTWLIASTNLSQLTSKDRGRVISVYSSVLGQSVDALDESATILINTQTFSEPTAHDSAVVMDLTVQPLDTTVGEVASVQGTARVINGPTSPWQFTGYLLEYGEGNDPQQWQPLAGPFDEQVHNDELAQWNTAGLATGNYTLRLSLMNNISEPITATSPAILLPSVVTGDLNGDGIVNQADLGILLSCYEINDCGDIDGDGDTDQADLGLLLANYSG